MRGFQLIEEIRRRIDELNPNVCSAVEPDDPVQKGDRVIGVVAEDLRKIFALYDVLVVEKLRALSVSELHQGEEKKRLLAEASKYNSLAKVTSIIFWHEVREQFPILWGIQNLAIRKGWKVVVVPDKESNGMIFVGYISSEPPYIDPPNQKMDA